MHQVPDFEAYSKQFAGNAEARAKAGVTRVVLTRLADDPKRVGLHFSAGSLDSVEKFLAGTDYRQLVEADRATESTVLWIATDELDELPNAIAPGTASLFKKFPVADVDCLVAGLTSNQSSLQAQGLLGFSLHRTESNPGVAILHLLASDRATIEKIYEGPLRPLLTGCGAGKLERPLIGTNQATP